MKKSFYLLILAGCMASLAGCGTGIVSHVAGEIIGELSSQDSEKGSSGKGKKERNDKEKQKQDDVEGQNGESVLPGEEEKDKSLENVQNLSFETESELNLMLEENYGSEWLNAEMLMDVTYDSLSASAKNYPGLAAALDNFHQKCDQEVQVWKQQHLSNQQESYGSEYFRTYEYKKSILPQRADAQVVSFAVQNYEYLGGAHG